MEESRIDRKCYAVQIESICTDLEFDDDGLLVVDREMSIDRSFVHYGPRKHIPYSPVFAALGLDADMGFTDQLVRYYFSNAHVSRFGIRLDMTQICEEPHYLVQKEHVRGPPGISLDRLRDPRFPEDRAGTLTEYVSSDFEEKIQVMWSARNNEKTVQIEEMVKISQESQTREHKTRYIHAVWDVGSERFVHYDGAVKYYQPCNYAKRWEAGLKAQDHGLSDRKEKLFRLDGEIKLVAWSRLTALFYRWNFLVEEYLCGDDKKALEDVRRISDLDRMVRKATRHSQ